uniref:Histone H2A/H2B/H3 domain-containing protein n=1 Tax=Acrobeloides nanus TaxID=290746 RepID=A0A914BUW1_9BILA
MNKKVETRAAFKKVSSPPPVRKIPAAIKRTKNLTRKSSRSLIRSTTPEMLRNVLNESFATFLATELGRLSPSRQLKARAKLENVISQYNRH